MRAKSDSSTTRAGASTASQFWAQVSHRSPGGGPREARRAWPHPNASRIPRAHDPTTQARPRSHRWPIVLLLGLMVVWSSLACAPRFVGPTPAGYFFTLHVPIWAIHPGDTAELRASVRNAQGQPVDGLPVAFEIEPGWAQSASVSPQVATTRQGTARALFQARTTGVVRIIVRVDTATQETRVTVAARPSPASE